MCGESGLAMRLFMPIAALLPRPMRISAEGTLLQRTQTPFEDIASQLKLSFASKDGLPPIFIQGPLLPKDVTVDGKISSQFLSGLLIAYAARGAVNCTISVKHLMSLPYIKLTLKVLEDFGCTISHDNYKVFYFDTAQTLRAASVRIAGDWSAAAYLLVAAALSGSLCVQGLRKNSAQADEAILDILQKAKCPVIHKHQLDHPDETSIIVNQAVLKAFHCNLEQSPDLFPALTALAAYAKGTSYLSGLHRLVNKESNRAKSIMEVLDRVGVKYEKNGDTLCIEGVESIEGGQHISSHGDHRLAMMGTLLALRSRQGLVVENSEVVAKSFPHFFHLFAKSRSFHTYYMNSLGHLLRMHIYGESHGTEVGVLIDGYPAGVPLSAEDFAEDLDRRRPDHSASTSRKEEDTPQIRSGYFQGYSTGAPLLISFTNRMQRSRDYEAFRKQPRPGHADWVAEIKYGGFEDPRGGGHFSGRLTLGLVAAGVLAKKILPRSSQPHAFLSSVAGESHIDQGLKKAFEAKDSVGGIVKCQVEKLPAGLGEPFFSSIESVISQSMFAIPAVKGIGFGNGFEATKLFGSQNNDMIINEQGHTQSNRAGGVSGGLSNGNSLCFHVAIKPTSSTPAHQKSFHKDYKSVTDMRVQGRHDLCIALRVPVVVEALTAFVLADFMLLEQKIPRVFSKNKVSTEREDT